MFLSPFLPPSQSTQQPFASVTSSNSTVSMATTPSPARVADTPGGASTPGLLLVATCSFVLLSIVAGVIIQAEHISDGCTSDFAVAAAAVPALYLMVAAAAALMFCRTASHPVSPCPWASLLLWRAPSS